ncbi:hypothetical protein EVAR_95147_1 [Eumeta japonica]|uniref:Uncharacterized protein n=1 Tax=Eumeta variegata TaxID=151549 RepID=A0A4C1W8J1_EUMVA|nr:hypothetical protein EVAR_95147_1 [Eumeta japonica]
MAKVKSITAVPVGVRGVSIPRRPPPCQAASPRVAHGQRHLTYNKVESTSQQKTGSKSELRAGQDRNNMELNHLRDYEQ